MHSTTQQIIAELAPNGSLCAAINLGNPVLAQPGESGEPEGISVALAHALANELGVGIQLRTFDAAGKVFAALDAPQPWTVAFLAIEPVRETQIIFSAPYVLIEGTYLVKADAPYTTVQALDQAGTRVAVGRGAAYDLYLSRTLEQADLIRADTSADAVNLFIEQDLEAAAGVRQPLEKIAAQNPKYRVLRGAFTTLRQAVAVPRANKLAAAYVHDFVERRLAEGFIRDALKASGQADVSAPR